MARLNASTLSCQTYDGYERSAAARAAYGNQVHNLCEGYIMFGPDVLESASAKYTRAGISLRQFVDLVKRNNITVEDFEASCELETNCGIITGRIDLIGYVNEQPAILDIKTGDIDEYAVLLQLSTYYHATGGVHDLYIIEVPGSGKPGRLRKVNPATIPEIERAIIARRSCGE